MSIVSKPEYADLVAAIPPDAWEKPQRSGPVSDNCLKTAKVPLPGGGYVWALGDTTNEASPIIILTQAEMDAFAGSAADGQYQMPA